MKRIQIRLISLISENKFSAKQAHPRQIVSHAGSNSILATAMQVAVSAMQAAVPAMQAAVPAMQAAVPAMQATVPVMQATVPFMLAAVTQPSRQP